MKKLALFILTLALYSTFVVAQGGTTFIQQQPPPTGAGAPATGGQAPQNTYAVATAGGTYTTVGGQTAQLKPGDVIVNPQTGDSFTGTIGTIDTRTATYVQTHQNWQSFQNGVYTFESPPSRSSGTIEDYATVTTVTIGTDGTKTVDQRSYVCGAGLAEECGGKWPQDYAEIPGSRQQVTYGPPATYPPAVGGIGTGPPPGGVTYTPYITTTYFDANNQPVSRGTANYKYNEGSKALEPTTVEVRTVRADGTPGDLIYTIDDQGEEHYWFAGNDMGNQPPGTLTPDQRAAIDRQSVNFVNSGGAHFGDACAILGTARCVGRFLRAFNEYAGLRQYSAIGLDDYDQQVQERRAEIQQEFCIAMGIAQCVASKICEQRHELQAGNIVAGRGPGGQFVTSAALNAERTPAIEIEGMTRQQLIDLFGNQTVIAGRLVNLTDPNFKPEALGRLKLRLYHVQYSITNNAAMDEDEKLSYNINFVRVPDSKKSSYGTPVAKATWYPAGSVPQLAYQETARDDLYKFSATEYSDVCLTFNPGLPSGGISGGSPIFGGEVDIVPQICVPFQESTTPTTATQPGAPPPTDVTTPQAPGGMI